MTKHTPGPWIMLNDCQIVTEDEDIVAEAAGYNGPLIATAPELLEALESTISWLENGHAPLPDILELKKVITKAKGEA